MAKTKIVPSKEMISVLHEIWDEIGMDVLMALGKKSISRNDVVEIVLDCDRPSEKIKQKYSGEQLKSCLLELELWRAQGYKKETQIAAMCFAPGRYGL